MQQLENKSAQNVFKILFIIISLISKILKLAADFWKLIHEPLFVLFDVVWKVAVLFLLSILVFGSVAFWPLDMLFSYLPIPETVQSILVTMQKTITGFFHSEPAQISPIINVDMNQGMSGLIGELKVLNENYKILVEQSKETNSLLHTLLAQNKKIQSVNSEKLTILAQNIAELQNIYNFGNKTLLNALNGQTKDILLGLVKTNSQTIDALSSLNKQFVEINLLQKDVIAIQKSINDSLAAGFDSNLKALNANQTLVKEYQANMAAIRDNLTTFQNQHDAEMIRLQKDTQLAKSSAEQAKQQASNVEAALPKNKEFVWSVANVWDVVRGKK